MFVKLGVSFFFGQLSERGSQLSPWLRKSGEGGGHNRSCLSNFPLTKKFGQPDKRALLCSNQADNLKIFSAR